MPLSTPRYPPTSTLSSSSNNSINATASPSQLASTHHATPQHTTQILVEEEKKKPEPFVRHRFFPSSSLPPSAAALFDPEALAEEARTRQARLRDEREREWIEERRREKEEMAARIAMLLAEQDKLKALQQREREGITAAATEREGVQSSVSADENNSQQRTFNDAGNHQSRGPHSNIPPPLSGSDMTSVAMLSSPIHSHANERTVHSVPASSANTSLNHQQHEQYYQSDDAVRRGYGGDVYSQQRVAPATPTYPPHHQHSSSTRVDSKSAGRVLNPEEDEAYQQFKRTRARMGIVCPSPERPQPPVTVTVVQQQGNTISTGDDNAAGGYASLGVKRTISTASSSSMVAGPSSSSTRNPSSHTASVGAIPHRRVSASGIAMSKLVAATASVRAASPSVTSSLRGGEPTNQLNNANNEAFNPQPLPPPQPYVCAQCADHEEDKEQLQRFIASLQSHLDEAVAVAEGQQAELDKVVSAMDEQQWQSHDKLRTVIADHEKQIKAHKEAMDNADKRAEHQQEHIIELTALVRQLQTQLLEARDEAEAAKSSLTVEKLSNTQMAAYVAQLSRRVSEARAEACEWKRAERAKMMEERIAYEAKANEALRQALLIGSPSTQNGFNDQPTAAAAAALALTSVGPHGHEPSGTPPSIANPLLLSHVESLAGQKALLEAMVAERQKELDALNYQVAERQRAEDEALAARAREAKEAADRAQWQREYEEGQKLQKQRAAEREAFSAMQRQGEQKALREARFEHAVPLAVKKEATAAVATVDKGHHTATTTNNNNAGVTMNAANQEQKNEGDKVEDEDPKVTALRQAFREEVERVREGNKREQALRILQTVRSVENNTAPPSPASSRVETPSAMNVPSSSVVAAPILSSSTATTTTAAAAATTEDPLLNAYVVDAMQRIERHKQAAAAQERQEAAAKEARLKEAEAAAAAHKEAAIAHKNSLVAKENEINSLSDSVRRYQGLLERATNAITAPALPDGPQPRRPSQVISEEAARERYAKLLGSLATVAFNANISSSSTVAATATTRDGPPREVGGSEGEGGGGLNRQNMFPEWEGNTSA